MINKQGVRFEVYWRSYRDTRGPPDTSKGFAEMSNDELAYLKYISSGENTLHVAVKGHVRNVDSSVTLLVEGGTLTFNNAGYFSSTGETGALLEATLGDFSIENTDGRRLK